MTKTNRRGGRVLRSANEALKIAKGELDPANHLALIPSEVNVKNIRETLGLTQSEFAARYRFSLARIRDWEQGRSRPDAAMRSYLLSISSGEKTNVEAEQAVKGVRRTRISAQSIGAWSNTRQAQELLPILLRRLIGRTESVTAVSMPGGDAVGTAGWDGVVSAGTGTPWVPESRSFWEIGTSARVDAKADSDYDKRSEVTPPDISKTSTFVFVTSRIWPKKSEWADSKRQSGVWRDIRAYDALDLEQWLELSPATAIWLGEQLGLSGAGVASVDRIWRNWADQTNPHLTPTTMLSHREDAEQRVLQAVEGRQNTVAIRADSVDEAVAFIAAAFMRAGKGDLLVRTLVVTADEGWRFVDANSEIDLVIVARPELARERALNEKMIVFIPFAVADRGAFYRGRAATAVDDGTIVVDRLKPRDFETALVDLGIDQADAQRLSRLTSRSWSVFRRLRATNPAIAKPAWLDHPAADALTTICLVGSWAEDRAADKSVVERIAGRPYNDLERDLRKLAALDDAPIMAIGSVWRAKSPLELLHLVGERITQEELERYFAAAQALLAAPDPVLELPEKDRWRAALYKKVRLESGLVFGSISDSLIKLAVYGPDVDNLAVLSIATRVGALVRYLLHDADSERWLSLNGVLADLAEAAPSEFLFAIEKSLQQPDPPVARLIRETAHSGALGGRCWHADLLRSLETLAWRPQDVARVIDILVKLTKYKVAGNWLNTPANTLLSLFRSWMPQTSAPLAQRIELLDRAIKIDPTAGWELLTGLGLKSRDFASPNARPKWRDDDAGAGHGTTRGEMHALLVAAETRLVAMAEGRPNRLAVLIDSLDQFNLTSRMTIIANAMAFAAADKSDADRAILREAVREHITWHKKFDDNHPNNFAENSNALEDLHRKLEPKSLGARHGWLFQKDWIDISENQKENVHEREKRVSLLRVQALREIIQSGGMSALNQFLATAGTPRVVGYTLADVFETPQDVTSWISTQKDQLEPGSAVGRAIRGLMFSLRESRGTVTSLVTREAIASWSQESLTNFFLACPCDRITWQELERADEAVRTTYWARTDPQSFSMETTELNELAARLLAANRPRSAFLGTELFMEKIEPALLYSMLDKMRIVREEGVRMPDYWHLGLAFDQLEKSGILSDQELARLEFTYVPALDHSERGLKLLNRWITTTPEVFFELLSGVYKPRHSPAPEPNEQLRQFATNAWTVLHHCDRIPGQDEDGFVDDSELNVWVTAVRALCKEGDREECGDHTIGEILSRAREGRDGIWPVEGIRALLDREDGEHIRHGFYIGKQNNRGVTSRAYDEGGSQERDVAKTFQHYADALVVSYPRLASTLRELQKNYEAQAKREDIDAQLRIEEP